MFRGSIKGKNGKLFEKTRALQPIVAMSMVLIVLLVIDFGIMGDSHRASDNMCEGCHGNRFKEFSNLLPNDPLSVLPTEFTENSTVIKIAVEIINTGDPGPSSYFEISSLLVTLNSNDNKLDIPNPQQEKNNLFPDEKVIFNWSVTGVLPGEDTLTISLYALDPHQNSVAIDTYSYITSVKVPYEPPSQPLNVTAIPGDGYILLSWNEPNDDGDRPIMEYRIYRGGDPGSETYYDMLSGTTTSYNDTLVTNGETYYYSIIATNYIGESEKSAEVFVTPYGRPAPPLNPKATSGNSYVELDWETSIDDGGSPIMFYNIYRGNSSGNETYHISQDINKSSYNDTSVTNGIKYYYYITAVNSVGESYPSIELFASPERDITNPSAPGNFEAIAGNGFVHLYWGIPSDDGGTVIMGYNIYRGINSGDETLFDSALGFTTSYNDTSIINGEIYYYYVTAVNPVGESEPSDINITNPRGPPEPPKEVQASVGKEYVMLIWKAPDNDGGAIITAFRIYRGDGSGNFIDFSMVSGLTLSYNDTSVINGVSYYYHVIAINSLGGSEPSKELNVIYQREPSAPLNLSGILSHGYVDLSWETPTDDGGLAIFIYNIYRGPFSGAETYYSSVNSILTQYRDGDPNISYYNNLYYYVTAVSLLGESAPSDEVNVTTQEVSSGSTERGLPEIISHHPWSKTLLVNKDELVVLYVETVGNVSINWYEDNKPYATGIFTLAYPVVNVGTRTIRARITNEISGRFIEITWNITAIEDDANIEPKEQSGDSPFPAWMRNSVLYGGMAVLMVLGVYLANYHKKKET